MKSTLSDMCWIIISVVDKMVQSFVCSNKLCTVQRKTRNKMPKLYMMYTKVYMMKCTRPRMKPAKDKHQLTMTTTVAENAI